MQSLAIAAALLAQLLLLLYSNFGASIIIVASANLTSTLEDCRTAQPATSDVEKAGKPVDAHCTGSEPAWYRTLDEAAHVAVVSGCGRRECGVLALRGPDCVISLPLVTAAAVVARHAAHPSHSRVIAANFAIERGAASFASADVLLLAVLLVAPKYGALVSALGGGLLACGGGDEPVLERTLSLAAARRRSRSRSAAAPRSRGSRLERARASPQFGGKSRDYYAC
jgi:hypothetical protein